jgi:RHS repeat-associated protein
MMRTTKQTATIVGVTLAALVVAAASSASGSGATASASGQVLGHMGVFTELIPIESPPFQHIRPEVSLAYVSGGGDGAAGTGWAINGIGVIERAGRWKGAPRYDANDIFLLDGQELVPCPTPGTSASCQAGGTHSTKIEFHLKITRDTGADKWYVWTTDGIRKTFAAVYGTGAGTFRWGLTEVRDTFNNVVNYNWWCESGADCYPDTITYARTTIRFLRAARTVPAKFALGVGIGTTNYFINKVRVEVDGALAREYVTTTNAGPGTQRDRVATLKIVGSDGTSSLPLVTYGYSGSAVSFSGAVGGPAMYVSGSSEDWAKTDISRVGYGDFNGDGKRDIARVNGANTTEAMTIALSNGNGTFAAAASGPSRYVSSSYYDTKRDISRVMYGDFNGDGKTDIAAVEGAVGACANMSIYLSNGNGTFAAPVAGPYRCISGVKDTGYADNYCRATFDLERLRVADVNGDGKDDIIAIEGWGTTQAMSVYLAAGSGTFTGAIAGPARSIGGSCEAASLDAARIKIADVNGDGRQDIVAVEGWGSAPAMSVYLGNGDGTFAAAAAGPAYSVSANLTTANVEVGRVNLVDANGDGKADIFVLGAPSTIYLSHGNGTFAAGYAGPSRSAGSLDDIARVKFGDFNGDGYIDLLAVEGACVATTVYLGRSNGTYATTVAGPTRCGSASTDITRVVVEDFSGDGISDVAAVEGWNSAPAMSIYLTQGGPHDLLTSIDNGIGATQTIAYVPSSAWSNSNNPPVTPTVQSVTIATQVNGTPWTATTTYSYSGGLFDHLERSSLGFYYERETHPCVSGETLCPYDETWFKQDFGSVGRPLERQRRRGDGVLLAKSVHTYTTNGATVPYVCQETEAWGYRYDGTGGSACPGANCVRTRMQHEYDSYGNVTRTYDHGNPELSGDEITSVFSFYPNPSAYIVSKHASATAYAGIGTGGTKLLESLVYYDGATAWTTPPTLGKGTKVAKWVSSSNSYVNRQSEYDSYGNVTAEIDEVGSRTTFSYDATYRTLSSNANQLGHSVSLQWNNLCGVPTKRFDVNNVEANYMYDPFCRLTRTYGPSGAYEEKSYVYGGVNNQYFETRVAGPNGGVIWGREYFDGLQRVYRKVSNGATAGQELEELATYDGRGQVSAKTMPFVTGATPKWITTLRDSLNRVVRVTTPDGAQRTTTYGIGYSTSDPDFAVALETVTETDPLGNAVRTASDTKGRVINRTEWKGTQELRVRYTYNTRGQRSSVTDPLGNVTTYTWDSLNRKLSHTDPDLGTWSYGYDAAGRMTSQTDALGQVTRIGFDVLGRRTSKTSRYGTGNAVTVTWTHDEARSGYSNKGHVTTVTDQYGSGTYDYNWSGQVNRYVRTIDSRTYEIQKTFDLGGRLLTTTFPDGETVTQQYDAAGRVTAVPGYVNLVGYDAMGNVSRLENANGTVTTLGYSDTRGWLNTIATTKGSLKLQDHTYTRDLMGKITQIASPFRFESWNYGYDGRGFLVSATPKTNAAEGQTFAYNEIGNLTANSRLGCYTYAASGAGSVRPRAVTAAGSNSYTYDANGNMLTGAGRTITWDGDNRPSQVGTTTFGYDADGVRLKKTVGAVVTHYLGDDVEWSNNVYTKYVGVAGRLVAKTVGSTKYWLHQDHLQSTQVVSDASGAEVQRLTYRPYGERLWSATAHAESRGFNSQRQDESGLFFLHARYFDPQLGRFISPDPITPEESVIGLNRYAYAGNDPINHVDSSGLGFWKSIKNFFKKVVKALVKFVKGIINLIKAALHGDIRAILTIVVIVVAWYVGGTLIQGLNYGGSTGWAAVGKGLASMTAKGLAVVGKAAVIMGATSAASGFVLTLVHGGSLSDALKAAFRGFISGAVNALFTAVTAAMFDGANVGLDTSKTTGGPVLKGAATGEGFWGFARHFTQDSASFNGGLSWTGNIWGKLHDWGMGKVYDLFVKMGATRDAAGYLTGIGGYMYDFINVTTAVAGWAAAAGVQSVLAERHQPSLMDRVRGKTSLTAEILDPMGAVLLPYSMPRSY